jgi:hypothetical protein
MKTSQIVPTGTISRPAATRAALGCAPSEEVAVPEIEHPPWCDPESCNQKPGATGFHHSRWIALRNEESEAVWHVALSTMDGMHRAWIDLVVIYPDFGPSWPAVQVELGLRPDMAVELAAALVELASQSGEPVAGVMLRGGPGISGQGGPA